MTRSGRARILLAAVVPALGFATGCDDDARDVGDLLREVQAAPRMPLPVSASPPVREGVAYTASSGRSPFSVPAPRRAARAGVAAARPDLSRPRQPLEAHALEELRVVGFLGHPSRRSALVRAPTGAVRTIAAGAYLGRNHGRVVSVDETGVEVIETVPDGAGAWIERRRLLKPAGR